MSSIKRPLRKTMRLSPRQERMAYLPHPFFDLSTLKEFHSPEAARMALYLKAMRKARGWSKRDIKHIYQSDNNPTPWKENKRNFSGNYSGNGVYDRLESGRKNIFYTPSFVFQHIAEILGVSAGWLMSVAFDDEPFVTRRAPLLPEKLGPQLMEILFILKQLSHASRTNVLTYVNELFDMELSKPPDPDNKLKGTV